MLPMRSLVVTMFFGGALLGSIGVSQAEVLTPRLIVQPSTSVIQVADQDMLVKGNAVNLRVSGARDAKAIGKLNYGTRVTVTETKGRWSHVTVNGQEGWVYSQFLVPAPK
jgi:SH3-like domain-containing protein